MATTTQSPTKRKRKSTADKKVCRSKDCTKKPVSYGYCKECSEKRKTVKKAQKKNTPTNGNGKSSNGESAHDTLDRVLPFMTTKELLEVRALDSEVRNAVLGMQVANLQIGDAQRKIEDAQRNYNAFVQQKQTERKALAEQLKTRQRERNRVLDVAAKRFGLDPEAMSYDDETGRLYDKRDDVAAAQDTLETKTDSLAN